MQFKNYRKKTIQVMRPYIPGECMDGISVSVEDTPEEGGMIAIGADNGAKWYVSKKFFNENYEEAGEGICEDVLEFSKTMQFKLDKNKRKPCDNMLVGGERRYEHLSADYLLHRLLEELIELRISVQEGKPEDILLEAADVGNFAMMIHANTRKA